MTALASHVTAFFQERLTLERRASVNTCDSYAYAFKLLLDYASKSMKVTPSRLQFEQIDGPLVLAFLKHLETGRSNGASSRNVRLAAIKSFMHFMEYRVPSAMEQIQRILAIPMKRTDTRLVRHLSGNEIQALLDAPKPVDWAGIRDRAMLHLCFAGGLRVSELICLAMQDLTLYPHASILVHGKGRVCFIKHTRPNVSHFYMCYSSAKTADFASKMPGRLFLTTHNKRRSMAAPRSVSKELRPCLSRYSNAGTTSLFTLLRPLLRNASGILRSVYAAEMPKSS